MKSKTVSAVPKLTQRSHVGGAAACPAIRPGFAEVPLASHLSAAPLEDHISYPESPHW